MKQLLIFFLATLLLLSGCGRTDNEIVDPGWEQYQQDQLESAPEQLPQEQAFPETFSMAYHKDTTLDPITCSEGIQQDIAALLYEGLFTLDSSFEPNPLLCESHSWDETGLVCTLNIRRDVLFSDGTPLTAADAAASLRRAAASERYGYRLRQMTAVTSNREQQVVITLTSPNRAFLSLLDIPVVKIGTEGQIVPVGTGPYLFVTGSEGNTLQANSDWWQKKNLPVSTIHLVHAKDQDTAAYLFSSRRVNLLTADPTSNQVPISGQTEETHRATTLLQFVGFNTRTGIFSSARARMAFSQGLQRDMLTSAFLSSHAQTAQFPISPLSTLYPKDLEREYSYDETLSTITALSQGADTTETLTLLVNEENSFRLSSAKYIAENLSLGNWQIEVKALPWEEYVLALTAGDFDLYYGEVRLTADWDLTDLIGTGGVMNYGGYTDPLTDFLLQSFVSSDNRQAATRQLCSHLQSTVPIAPICFRDYTVMTHPQMVEGLAPTPGNTFTALENWTIHLK